MGDALTTSEFRRMMAFYDAAAFLFVFLSIDTRCLKRDRVL
jgi:hypothetical protein